MVKHWQTARQIKKEIREEDYSALAVEAIDRNITIPINGLLTQKTIIRSLVGMSANKLSVPCAQEPLKKLIKNHGK